MLTVDGRHPFSPPILDRGNAVKISIDSAEPLHDVLRVISALYDVTLAVTTSNDAGQTTPAIANRDSSTPTRGKTATKSRGRGRSTKKLGRVSTAELRSWAQENGHPVSDRGPIPAAVSVAYQQAQRG